MKSALICLMLLVAICNAYDGTGYCMRRMQRYNSGMVVLQRVDEENNVCRGKVCLGGKVRSWTNRKCFEPYKQCDYEQADGGKLDAGFGIVVHESSGMCKGVVCIHGRIKEYSGTSCPMPPTTSMIPTTPGCLPGESTTGRSGNWCHGTFCQDGVKIFWDNFNCGETTPQPTTPGCVEGEKTSFKDGSWCHGTLCQDGVLISWDNFNCDEETTTTPPSSPALPSDIQPTTTTPAA